jgi:hypothetical protein
LEIQSPVRATEADERDQTENLTVENERKDGQAANSQQRASQVSSSIFFSKKKTFLCKSCSVDCPMLADILWFSTGLPKFKIFSAKLIRLLFVNVR